MFRSNCSSVVDITISLYSSRDCCSETGPTEAQPETTTIKMVTTQSFTVVRFIDITATSRQ